MSIPGTILSQEPNRTNPSNSCAPTINSILSHITSLVGSTYPFCETSHTPIVPNSTGMPPAWMMPFLTASDTCLKFTCPGQISLQVFAIAITGLPAISSTLQPSSVSICHLPFSAFMALSISEGGISFVKYL